MVTRIIKIGNSRGIRIPKVVLEQVGLRGEVEMEVAEKQIVIRPVSSPRQGWEAAFEEMARRQDDRLPDDEAAIVSKWDEDEWEW